jgi:lipopolysaccharide export system permease protein
MRLPRILARRALREALVYAAIGLLGVSSILVTQNLLRELAGAADVGLTPSDVLALVAALTGILSAYAVPIAFLFGVVAAVGRLSADAEVLAMRSLGISLAQLALPFVLLGLVASAATALLLGEIEPRSRRTLRSLAADIAARGALIQPGRLRHLDRQGLRMLLVEEGGADGNLDGVFLSDHSDPQKPFTVLAERGRFDFDRDSAIASMRLEAGDVLFDPPQEDGLRAHQIHFEELTYSWDMSDFLGASLDRVKARELRNGELLGVIDHFDRHGEAPAWARMKERWRYEIQLQRRFALAAAPLVLAPIGVSLGLRRTRDAGSWGALVCAILVFAYYVLLSFGSQLAREGTLSAAAGLWLPNALFAVAGLALLAHARHGEV